MRSLKELGRLVPTDVSKKEKTGGKTMIFDPEDAKTMRYIGINILSLIGVTLILIIGATILG